MFSSDPQAPSGAEVGAIMTPEEAGTPACKEANPLNIDVMRKQFVNSKFLFCFAYICLQIEETDWDIDIKYFLVYC